MGEIHGEEGEEGTISEDELLLLLHCAVPCNGGPHSSPLPKKEEAEKAPREEGMAPLSLLKETLN